MKNTVARFAASCGVLFLLSCHKQTPEISKNFFSYQLALSDGSLLNFETLKSNKASVFIFLAPDCPQSQSYTLTLNELHAKFSNADVGFYGVVAGNKYDSKEINGFITKYRIHLPMVLDPKAALAKSFGALVTPEAFVVSSEGIPVYQGSIDNWAPELGQHRTVITEHYLLDALNSFIQTGRVSVNKTKAVGCFIERGN